MNDDAKILCHQMILLFSYKKNKLKNYIPNNKADKIFESINLLFNNKLLELNLTKCNNMNKILIQILRKICVAILNCV